MFAQNKKDPEYILKNVRDKFSTTVKDYSVDAHIKVDVDFLKTPDMDARIYFKQPDKVKLNSQGFAMLPKQAFNLSPERFLKDDHNSLYVGQENINNSVCDVVKVLPKAEDSDIILSTLWVDKEKSVIRKVESAARKGGSFIIELNYDNKNSYPLPVAIKFTFDLPRYNAPRGLAGGNSKDQVKGKSKTTEKGTVYVTYSNYSINKGLSDSIFEEKKK